MPLAKCTDYYVIIVFLVSVCITGSNFFSLEIGFFLSFLTVPVPFSFHFYHIFFSFSQIEYQCYYVA